MAALIKSSEMVKGQDALRLRVYFSSECMEPSRDLDRYGRLILEGDEEFSNDYISSLNSLHNASPSTPLPTIASSLSAEIAKKSWGPTGVRVYNLLGLFMQILPVLRPRYLEIASWFIDMVELPVDLVDYSGTTALSHAISTKPALDLQYAQMLYDAGADVNHRNRFGATAAHEIVKVYTPNDATAVKKATTALSWFLSHGGNVDIADTDGVTVRSMVERQKDRIPSLLELVQEEDQKRQRQQQKADSGCCWTCGREDSEDLKLLRCGRCKKALYCPTGIRNCQRLDWPSHKRTCTGPESK